MKKIFFALVLSLLTVATLYGAGSAQDATPPAVETITDDQVNAIAKQLYCPVCENIPLDVCPTQACAEWRELIRLRLSQGRTQEEIKAEFAKQYGDRVLALPPAKGLSILVYVIPPLAILSGAAILVQSLRAMRRGKLMPAPEAIPDGAAAEDADSAAVGIVSNGQTDDYIRRVEEELRKR